MTVMWENTLMCRGNNGNVEEFKFGCIVATWLQLILYSETFLTLS